MVITAGYYITMLLGDKLVGNNFHTTQQYQITCLVSHSNCGVYHCPSSVVFIVE